MLIALCLLQVSIAQEVAVEIDTSAVAVEEAAESLADDAREDPASIDEITVMGARSLLTLNHQVERAEINFYERYNEVNTDDRYDVICKDAVHVGSRIPVRECIPRVVREMQIQATQMAITIGGNPSSPTLPLETKRKHDKELQEKLKKFVISDQDLQNKLMEYDALSRKYQEERAKKYGDKKEIVPSE